MGCGSSGSGGAFGIGDGGSSSGAHGDASSGSSGSTSGSGGDEDASGDDATTEGGGSGSGGSSDASLDISFPDSFFGPDGSGSGSGSSGGDSGPQCSPQGVTCQGTVANSCLGGVLTTQDCSTLTPPESCANGYGCVVCQPGTGSCNGSTGTACNSQGTGTTTNVCDPLQGETCDATTGQCDGDCGNLGASYIGCEYYAVTMLNHLIDQGTFYFSVSLSNTTSKTASVNVQGGALASPMTVSIPAGQLTEVKLPWVKPLSCGSGTCNGNQLAQPTPPGTTLQSVGAYHIRSTEPITAYEFNARDYVIGSEYSYTNDASLLVPVNAMTGAYHVASWPTFGTWPGLMTVVATQPNTKVTVAATNPIQTTGTLTATGGSITLPNAGDVLQIMTALNSAGGATYGTDPSGSAITANNPIEVFGGHSCVYIPASTGYCDHIEQIAFPDETLRGDYLVTL
ncbi:MAG TPA: IgGFc-binding protein, partial [Polyangiaceae bacterium]